MGSSSRIAKPQRGVLEESFTPRIPSAPLLSMITRRVHPDLQHAAPSPPASQHRKWFFLNSPQELSHLPHLGFVVILNDERLVKDPCAAVRADERQIPANRMDNNGNGRILSLSPVLSYWESRGRALLGAMRMRFCSASTQ